MRAAVALLCGALLGGCAGSPAPAAAPAAAKTTPTPAPQPATNRPAETRSQTIRWSGTLEAVRSTRVSVPSISGPNYNMTVTRIIRNGAVVAKGDLLAEFDPLEQLNQARDSAAKFDDLSHQVRQRQADNAANAEKRQLERDQAEADLAKARLDVSKASVLGTIEVQQNEIRFAKARARVESLQRTHPQQEQADRAALRILELQRDRQRQAQERARQNLEKLRVTAPLAGMVALSTFYNNGSMVRPQAGDRLYRNNTLLSIFDPGEMLVRVNVAEPDGALLTQGLRAKVLVDAYPDLTLAARFVAASPVAAAAALGRGSKTFTAVFKLEGSDPRLMPDLSAAIVFDVGESRAPADTVVTAALTPAGDAR